MAVYPLNAVRVKPPKKATATLIFFHGLGDSGQGWSFLPEEIYRKAHLQHIKVVLPNAPIRRITAFRQDAPAWFDVAGFGAGTTQDVEGTMTALNTVRAYIDEEITNGTPADRIMIGGFSQGAALTTATAITLDKKLAGFIPVSGFVPVVKALVPKATGANKDTPLMMLHGREDEIVPYADGVKSRDILKSKFEFNCVEWHDYPNLAHNVSPEGIAEMLKFMERVVPEV